ncbi:MAG: cytochrome c3 family protein [Desulfobacterales bacterium]|jgi:hypothetical protein
MNKKLLALAIVACATLFVVAGIYAAVEEVIIMKNEAYPEHEKGIVEFHHKKHAEEYAKKYPDLYPNGCGDCHHDENNKPLKDLTEDSEVKSCIECHKKPGEVPKDLKKEWRAKKVKKAEKKKMELEYHAEALHANCRGCHREYNKKYKPSEKAPTTCTKCHPKTK